MVIVIDKMMLLSSFKHNILKLFIFFFFELNIWKSYLLYGITFLYCK